MRSVRPHVEITIRLAVVEYCAAFLGILWGVWVILYPEAMSGPAYDAIRDRIIPLAFGRFSSSDAFGLLSIAIGLFYTVAIWINGRGLVWTPFVRMLAPIGGILFFGNVLQGIFQSSPTSTAVPTYAFATVGYFALFYANLSRVWEAMDVILSKLPYGRDRGGAAWKN